MNKIRERKGRSRLYITMPSEDEAIQVYLFIVEKTDKLGYTPVDRTGGREKIVYVLVDDSERESLTSLIKENFWQAMVSDNHYLMTSKPHMEYLYNLAIELIKLKDRSDIFLSGLALSLDNEINQMGDGYYTGMRVQAVVSQVEFILNFLKANDINTTIDIQQAQSRIREMI